MAKYAQLVATGLPSGVQVTIKDSNGRQVPNLFPSADATAPDNRARTANSAGVLYPATYLPNGTYTVAYSGGSTSVVVSGASGLPAATPFDMATQTELDDQDTENRGAYTPLVKVSDLVEPIIMAHRGGLYVAPESTQEGFDYGLSMGTRIVDVDVQQISDGTLVVCHDGTFDAMTTATGTIFGDNYASWKQRVVDVGAANGWTTTQRLMTLAEVFKLYGGKAVICVENKLGTVAIGQAIVAMVQQFGLTTSVIYQSAFTADIPQAVAAGLACQYISDSATPAQVIATGATTQVFSKTVADATITAAIAAGLKVWVYEVNRRSKMAAYVALGVSGIVTADPGWLTRGDTVQSLTDRFTTLAFQPGSVPSDISFNRGVFTSPKYWGYTETTNQYWGRLIGTISPMKNNPNADSYTLDFNVIFDAINAGDTTRYIGVMITNSDANWENNGLTQAGVNGWFLQFDAAGLLQVRKVTNGVAVLQSPTVATSALTLGTTVAHLRVTKTPTSIKWERTDVAGSKLVTDAAFPGGFVNFGRAGVSARFSDLVVA